MAAPSFLDYFNIGRAEALSRRSDLTFDEGDISEFLIAGGAAMADHLTGYFANRFKATYLDGASGDDLTILADDHWNVQRNQAIRATAQVLFSRTSGNGYPAGLMAAGFVVATAKDNNGNDIQYTLDADLNWILNQTTATANVTAIASGSAGNADLNKIIKMITTPFDDLITVNNPVSKAAGGEDEETDDALRDRVRNLPLTLQRGTLAALEYGAKAVPGVTKASAVEEVDPLDISRLTGVVDVYVSDSNGGSSVPMVAAVDLVLESWKAAGTTVNTYGGNLLLQNISLTITARAGVDTISLVSKIQSAVTARVNKLRIGESLDPDIIKQATFNVSDDILSVTVVTPSVTVVPTADQLIKAGTVSVS